MPSLNEFHLQPSSLFARNLHWTRDVTLKPCKRRWTITWIWINPDCTTDKFFMNKSTSNFLQRGDYSQILSCSRGEKSDRENQIITTTSWTGNGGLGQYVTWTQFELSPPFLVCDVVLIPGLLLIFLHGCKIKSGSGLETRLQLMMYKRQPRSSAFLVSLGLC